MIYIIYYRATCSVGETNATQASSAGLSEFGKVSKHSRKKSNANFKNVIKYKVKCLFLGRYRSANLYKHYLRTNNFILVLKTCLRELD